MARPYYDEGGCVVYHGDALDVLREMASESVHCCVTSPPYWGLRDYGVEGQLGLEKTPEEYVARLAEVCREVRRVLRRDGTCWLNLGDSYASNSGTGRKDLETLPKPKGGHVTASPFGNARPVPVGYKPKDLVGIPWMVAFALRADGWWLRSDIIWSKPNPMPESVTDRPTKAHEYLFLLTRAERYYYDADAVRESATNGERFHGGYDKAGLMESARTHGRNGRGDPDNTTNGRNLRSVWTIATQPYPEAHFATFPEDLVIPCIRAGTSEHGVCPQCGSPWVRVVERDNPRTSTEYKAMAFTPREQAIKGDPHFATRGHSLAKPGWRQLPLATSSTVGWRPACTHGQENGGPALQPVPATVLDPFAGSGTTSAIARRVGRRSIGVELQAEYLPLIRQRVEAAALPLLELRDAAAAGG